MKSQIITRLGIGITIAVIFSSCLSNKDEDIQTKQEEQSLLNEYIFGLESEGNDVDTTDLGVYYVVINESDGIYPQTGDTLTLSYKGYLMDGYNFDNSEYNFENGEWTFVYGETQVIAGWDDGMKVINKGAKVQLMIPSDLAYGENGYGSIPPNNTLIFVIEMKDINPKI